MSIKHRKAFDFLYSQKRPTQSEDSSSEVESSDCETYRGRNEQRRLVNRKNTHPRRGGRGWGARSRNQRWGSGGYDYPQPPPTTSASSSSTSQLTSQQSPTNMAPPKVSSFFRKKGDTLHPSGPSPNTEINIDENQIINLTTYSFTMHELSVLKKGLGFVPITRFSSFTWIKDIHVFVRKLKWKSFFEKNKKKT